MKSYTDYEKKQEINIPEGFTATIDGDKIILTKTESEDDKIRKEIVSAINIYCSEYHRGTKVRNDMLAWLENQDNIDKTSYEIVEKEKYDFVTGHFIECRKSFNEFKKDNSYWLEYIGNDTYIGRSDNILNKEFHITPRQLYHLFSQQHSPKENGNGLEIIVNEDQIKKNLQNHDFRRMFEQKSTEWSEEDEKQLNDIIELLPNLTNRHNWLKSLKDRVQHQTIWKPSEEQLNTLDLVVSDYYHACTKESDKKAIVLKYILEQLKQL